MKKTLQRISYVEDENDIRTVGELALTAVGGFEVDVCVNGEEALNRIPIFGPDLVLLDVMMPGLNGEDVFKELKAIPALRDLPIIFMTAKAQPNEVEEYLALGAAGVIPKPFEPMTLHERVREIWNSVFVAQVA